MQIFKETLVIIFIFRLEPCRQDYCIHKVIKKNILQKAESFDYWKKNEIPKIFAAKLKLIRKKFCFGEESSTIDVDFKEHESVAENKNNVRNNATSDVNEENKKESLKKSVKSFQFCEYQKSKLINKIDELMQSSFNGTEKVNSKVNLNEDMSEDINMMECNGIEKDIKNISAENSNNLNKSLCLNMNFSTTSQNSNIYQGKESINTYPHKCKESVEEKNSSTKSKKLVKPFSVGEVLSNLKSELNRSDVKISNTGNEEKEQCFENGYNSFVRSEEIDENSQSRKRKRKRVRKSKSKTKICEINFCPNSFQHRDFNSSLVDKKPSHIRFNRSSESEETEDCVKESSTDCNKSINLVTTNVLQNTSVGNSLQITNNNMDLTPSVSFCSSEKNYAQRENIPDTPTKVNKQDHFSVAGIHSDTEVSFKQSPIEKSLDNMISSIKSTFSSPVVFERFY